MGLFLIVGLTLIAFAGNSVLTRLGVAHYGMDPLVFAVIRTGAGAAMLAFLVLLRGKGRIIVLNRQRLAGGAALALYMLGFSWSYLTLDAGLGALILFGVLQVVVFGWAVIEGQQIAMIRWIGAGVAMVGLTVLLWPGGAAAVPFAGAMAMILAGASWAVYTLLGRGEADALGATAGNFILCFPMVIGVLAVAHLDGLTAPSVITAIIAGAVTSGIGYASWYRCMPHFSTVTAGVTQLSVPVIAVVAGGILLGEPLTWRLVIAGALVLGGIAISLRRANG